MNSTLVSRNQLTALDSTFRATSTSRSRPSDLENTLAAPTQELPFKPPRDSIKTPTNSDKNSSPDVERAHSSSSGHASPRQDDYDERDTETCTQLAGRYESHRRTRNLFRKKSHYYDEAFACRGKTNDPRERVISDSVILAEMSLSNSLRIERSFLNDFSFQLSEIYQRPASCIMVVITMQSNMILGDTSEPAYSVTISALPSEIAPTKNKRSTHFIQNFIFDALEIKPNRGIIRFEAVFEENLATNGKTALQEIEQLAKQSKNEFTESKTVHRQKNTGSKDSSVPMLRERRPVSSEFPKCHKTWTTKLEGPGITGVKHTDMIGLGPRKVKTRKSIMNLFRK